MKKHVSQSISHRWKITTKWITDHIPQNSTVLDIGIGSGKYWEPIDSNYNIIGLDVTHNRYTKYQLKYITNLEKNDLAKIMPEKFKYICMFEVLEHLENPYYALRNIHKIIKDNGIFIGSTPNRMDYQLFVKAILRREIYLHDSHRYLFDKITLSHMFRKTGFKVIHMKSQPFPYQIVKYVSIDLSKKIPFFGKNLFWLCQKESTLL